MVDKYDKEIQDRLIEVQVKFYQSHNQQIETLQSYPNCWTRSALHCWAGTKVLR